MEKRQSYFGVTSAAKYLKISKRSIQRRCERYNILKVGNRYRISEAIILEWEKQIELEKQEAELDEARKKVIKEEAENAPSRDKAQAVAEDIILEEFTKEEWAEAMKRISQYPQLIERIQDYRAQVEYLQKSLDSKASEMQEAFKAMQESLQAIFSSVDATKEALANTKRDQYLKYQDKK